MQSNLEKFNIFLKTYTYSYIKIKYTFRFLITSETSDIH